MNVMKTFCAAFALTTAFAGSAFAQSPFGFWGTPMTANCPGGVCPPSNCANGQCNQPRGMNCVNGVCYQSPAMNCQNGICTPAYGTVHTPVATPTAAPRNVPFIANNGSAPYFGSGASVPQFNRNSYSTPISGSTLTSGQGNLGNRPFIPANMSGIAQLPVWEQQAALNQRTCAVTGELLGSHGTPIRTTINGQSVFVCCQDCLNQNRQIQYGGQFHNTNFNRPAFPQNYSAPLNYQASKPGFNFH